MRRTLVPMLALGLAACGTRTALHDPAVAQDAAMDSPPCPSAPMTCVAAAPDPCDAPVTVAAVCDAAAHAWHCPANAWPYARTSNPPAVCLPFHDAAGSIRAVGGSLVRVPTDDGRCLTIVEDLTLTSGAHLRNVAMDTDLRAPFGACPSTHFTGGTPTGIVTLTGNDDPAMLVQITGGFRFGTTTRVTYRLFRIDASAGFGVREIGTGLGHWEPRTQRLVVQGVPDFGIDLDLGDASFVDGNFAYVYGCPSQPAMLAENCLVGRLDAAGLWQLYAGRGSWISSLRGSDGATVFDAGPWISTVFRTRAGLSHVAALGFATSLVVRDATHPEGPWSTRQTLARCDLAPGDTHAFCAGPVVHTERIDPLRPAELPITYGVGTTAADGAARTAANPAAYWSRLHFISRP